MANLEKLIAFWEKVYMEFYLVKVYNAKNASLPPNFPASLPPNILIHINDTISALSELKRLKEGTK